MKNVYALAKVKKDVPDWTLPSFKEEACALYKEVCAAIAAGDHHELRHRTTESLLANIKRCANAVACARCARALC